MASARLTTRDILVILVGFPSVSDQSNLPLLDWVEEYVRPFGVRCRRTYNADKTKGNLLISMGPEDKAGVVLSGHTDVVPTSGQNWSSDPFTLTEREGKLYGRGTCDMKGFLAAVLAKLPDFVAAPLQKPIHIALSHDEEVGCIGVGPMLDDMANLPVLPEMVIIGEPTSMHPVIAHKSKLNVDVTVRGFECHSSLAPRGVNAVDYAAELVSFIRARARHEAEHGARDEMFDIPHTTLHTGVFQGGTALNIVPKACRVEFEVRALPDQDTSAVLEEIQAFVRTQLEPEMQAIRPETGFEWHIQSDAPGFTTPADHPLPQLVARLTGHTDFAKVAYSTEAGRFQARWDLPCVLCGPGDIDQAHKPDEFISLDQIRSCEVFLSDLLQTMV